MHVFSARLKTTGSQSITATDAANASISGMQSGIIVTPATASTLVISAYPSPTTAGAAQNFTVTVYDTNGNVDTNYTGTIHFTSSDPKSTAGNGLPSNYTFTAGTTGDDNGMHTFSATLKTAGTQSITATDTVSVAIHGTDSGIIVDPAIASILVVSGYPSPTIAGSAHQFTVTADDPYGNVATSYTGTVHFTSTDTLVTPGSGLPLDFTFTTGPGGDDGTHAFSVTLKSAGTQSITVADTETPGITGTQSGIIAAAAMASGIKIVSRPPGGVIAGKPFSISVNALDLYGNLDTSFSGNVTVRLASGPGTLTGKLMMPATAGVAVFDDLVDTSSGDIALSAASGTLTGDTTPPIPVAPATPAQFAVATSFNNTDVAGTLGTVTITALDQYSNPENGSSPYEGTVNLSSTDAQLAGLPATYTFVAVDAGSHTFDNVILETAGSQSITATDSASSVITGTSPTVSVVPAAAHKFIVTTSFANPDVAGTPASVAVTAKDLYGNIVGNGLNQYEGMINLTSTDAKVAGLPAAYTFVAADAGSHTFSNVVLETAGNQSITATDAVSSAITGTSPGVNVVPAIAHNLFITTSFQDPDVAGTPGTVTVTAKDLYGNIAGNGPKQYKGTLELTGTDAKLAGLPASYTFVTADAGSHTFNNVILETAGSQSITATDSASSLITGISAAVSVIPAAAYNFVVNTNFANPDVAGTSGTVSVAAKDPYGNTADTGLNQYEGMIDLTSTDAKLAGLPAIYTFVSADAGSHTFNNVVLKTAGSQSIRATDSISATITGVAAVNVVAAQAAQLVVTISPPDPIIAGQPFNMAVSAEDQFGNVNSSFSGSVTISLANAPGFPVTVQATNGVATFTGLTTGTAAQGESIVVTSSRLAPENEPPDHGGAAGRAAFPDNPRRTGHADTEEESQRQDRRQGGVLRLQVLLQHGDEPHDHRESQQLYGRRDNDQAHQEQDQNIAQAGQSISAL